MIRLFRVGLVLALIANAVSPASLRAQPVRTTAATANASDVASINGIIAAVYATLSGPKGRARDWQRFRTLFAPDARLIAVIRRKGAHPVLGVFTVDRYIELDAPIMMRKGFFEVETGRAVSQFHGIASVFSSYAAHFEGGPVIDKGVNNFQLFFEGSRWYIVSIYWDSSDFHHAVPKLPRPEPR